MVAGKADTGSMGDFPLLLNAARGTQLHAPTRLVSVTGYNLRGALNALVTKPGSALPSSADLRGKTVSRSVGSSSDGTLVRALQRAGIDPERGIRKLNQQSAVGASALQSGSADALSQFVAWPGLLAFQSKAQAFYDGGALGLLTFHGVTYGTPSPDNARTWSGRSSPHSGVRRAICRPTPSTPRTGSPRPPRTASARSAAPAT